MSYSSLVTGVVRLGLSRRYIRLQSVFVVAAVRCVANSILLHECWPLLLGLLNAPDTCSMPAPRNRVLIPFILPFRSKIKNYHPNLPPICTFYLQMSNIFRIFALCNDSRWGNVGGIVLAPNT